MKKKLAVLVLASAMMLSACGGKETVADDVEAAVEETVDDAEGTVETEVEETVEEVADDVEEIVEEVVEDAEEALDYAKGTLIENGWESKWLGLRFTAPEGMVMSTEEELAEIMGVGQEILAQDFSEQQLAYAELATVYEMMCSDAMGTNVILMAEKLPMTLTAEQYIEILANQMTSVTAIQYEVESNDEVVTLGGIPFNKLACVADYEGISLCQDYYITIKDNRAVAIAVTYTDATADVYAGILNGFTAY